MGPAAEFDLIVVSADGVAVVVPDEEAEGLNGYGTA